MTIEDFAPPPVGQPLSVKEISRQLSKMSVMPGGGAPGSPVLGKMVNSRNIDTNAGVASYVKTLKTPQPVWCLCVIGNQGTRVTLTHSSHTHTRTCITRITFAYAHAYTKHSFT